MGRPTTAKEQLTTTVVAIASIGPKRGLSREEAANYIGISPTKFTALVADGRMPKPIPIDSRLIWDMRALDRALDALASANDDDESNSWDDVM